MERTQSISSERAFRDVRASVAYGLSRHLLVGDRINLATFYGPVSGLTSACGTTRTCRLSSDRSALWV
jgi:hypothetical protein